MPCPLVNYLNLFLLQISGNSLFGMLHSTKTISNNHVVNSQLTSVKISTLWDLNLSYLMKASSIIRGKLPIYQKSRRLLKSHKLMENCSRLWNNHFPQTLCSQLEGRKSEMFLFETNLLNTVFKITAICSWSHFNNIEDNLKKERCSLESEWQLSLRPRASSWPWV